jgi:hypothetical protein
LRFLIPAVIALLSVLVVAGAIKTTPVLPPSAEAAVLPGLPAGWPSRLELGISDGPGGASGMRATAPYGFRYQYLAGGVNTGNGWANWNPNGSFVSNYIQESVANGIVPVFTYYMIYQSNPGASQSESNGVRTNLQNTSTMTAYWNDLKLFFQRAGAFDETVVLHVEPDLWGYVQQQSSGDSGDTFTARVGSTGLPELAGLPDNMSGFARAIVKLRDTFAPNARLGYHLSVWGTGEDIVYTNPSDARVDLLATRAANFYTSLQANFDVVFAEFSDRDSGFKQYIYGDGGASWWDAGDFARNVRFLSKFVSLAQKRIVMWQIPMGNTKMRAVNNTWNHYQDNRPEWLLDEPARTHLTSYVQAGVVAFLFGRGADGATCACDANRDGVTNPSPINGNNLVSLNADDDGGFFRQKVELYYSTGAMPLSGDTPPSTPTALPATPTPSPAPATATNMPPSPTPTRTPTPTVAPLTWTTSASVSSSSIRRGNRQTIIASVRSSRDMTVLVDIEVYSPSGAKVYQFFVDNVVLTANTTKYVQTGWTIPGNIGTGTYTVKIGIFSPGWGQLYHWNNAARTFTIR